MSFADAVKHVLSSYATFSGRARRSENWFWFLAFCIIGTSAELLDMAMGVSPDRPGVVTVLLGLALFLPNLAVTVRRLHDIGRSGWWILIGVIPILGVIVLLVWHITDSQGDNRYGPSPKRVPVASAVE